MSKSFSDLMELNSTQKGIRTLKIISWKMRTSYNDIKIKYDINKIYPTYASKNK